MNRGPARPAGRARPRRDLSFGGLVLSALLIAGAGCRPGDAGLTLFGPAPDASPVAAFRVYAPLLEAPLGATPPAVQSRVRIDGILQNGPQNQILVLRNEGDGPERLGGWTIELEGTGPIYRFEGGIIPPFEGKFWVTTSRLSRLSAFTLGYHPEDAGARYRIGNKIYLRNFAGEIVDTYEVREIGNLPLPGGS